MSRLAVAMRWDISLQRRQGFYFAALFVATLLILLLRQLNPDSYPLLLPLVAFSNININAFYFFAGLVLLEKGDNVLEGLVVTPLREWEYLWAKLFTLTLLSLAEQVVVVSFVIGSNYNIPLFIVGVIFMSLLNGLIGFIAVVRYDSLNAFIFPSVFVTMLMGIPLLDFFGIWSTPLMLLHPLQAPLLLLKGAFSSPLPGWQLVYGVGYSLVATAVFYQLARRAFYKYLILKQR